VDLSSEADRLTALVDAGNDGFDYVPEDMLPRQIQAADERFKDRVEKIKLLQNRAETGGVGEIRSMADIVPLLFAHTAYKSYPENWLIEQKWDRLGKWLDTVSTYRVKPIDTSGIKGFDDWLVRLEDQGHYVSCSSGTTGKSAMMNSSAADLAFCGKNLLGGVVWSDVGAPLGHGRMIRLGQVAATPRNSATSGPLRAAVTAPGVQPFTPDVPPITIGGITDMVVLRKKIAEGVAKPGEIARFEAEAAEREAAMDDAIEQAANAIIEGRETTLFVMGMFATLYRVAERVRAKGYSAKDFQPNSGFIGGGLKRAPLPANWREVITETLNLPPERLSQGYGMQELNTNAFRCQSGRYHVPAWHLLLLLDESGETLVEPPKSGEIEGRAAFLDLSMDGRWGGVISGDKIRARWDRCACGRRSPSIAPEIERYADSANGDKIACAGTIDAYVRGVV
jgi:hypothetical protein